MRFLRRGFLFFRLMASPGVAPRRQAVYFASSGSLEMAIRPYASEHDSTNNLYSHGRTRHALDFDCRICKSRVSFGSLHGRKGAHEHAIGVGTILESAGLIVTVLD